MLGLLRKHVAWVIVGIAFLGEVGAMFFVFGKQGEARAARENLEKRRDFRDNLQWKIRGDVQRKVPGIDERIDVLKERREIAGRELADCLVFLWHQGRAIEGLFDAKELAAYDARPWQELRNLHVFKVEYQTVYKRELAKLEPLMQKIEADAGMLGFADTAGGLAAANVTLGDVFAKQKEFWIRKAIVEVLASSDAVLQQPVTLGVRAGPGGVPLRHAAAPGAGPAPVSDAGPFIELIPLQLTFACDYTRLHKVLRDFLRSPLCLRITSVTNVARAKLVERPMEAPPPPKEAPGKEAPAKEPAPKGRPGAPVAAPPGKEHFESASMATAQQEKRKYVTVTLHGDVCDLRLELLEVKFPKAPAFSDRTKVLAWLAWQLQGLEKRAKSVPAVEDKELGPGDPEPKRPELSEDWIAKAILAAERAAGKPGDKAPAEGPKQMIIADKLTQNREYSFADLDGVKEWLGRRYDFEHEKLDAYQSFWRQVRQLVEAGKLDDRTKVGVSVGDGVLVVFRPADECDPAQVFEVQLDAGITAKLGLQVPKFRESRDGVKTATSSVKH